MAFTAKDVVDLREKTGAGMLDCKKALTECNGDMSKAVDYLREKGIAAVAKRQGRIAAEGAVFSYIHMNGTIGVLLEVNCETDFVAKSPAFQELGHDIAIHIAAANPKYINIEEVDTTELEKEKEILKAQALNEGKPAAVVDKMVEGRIKKYYKEVCLLEQEYVKDPSKTISQLVADATNKIGEKISIRRFVRFQMGEGLEKRKDDFAEEVKKQAAGMM
ncbi:MAG: translation elongation factor Ts [Clostridia bacterium]|nr:translation elongation factor Ts [Clostridia bacterium]